MEGFWERQEFPGKNVGKVISIDGGLTRRGGNYLLSRVKTFSTSQSLTHSVENDVCLGGSCAF